MKQRSGLSGRGLRGFEGKALRNQWAPKSADRTSEFSSSVLSGRRRRKWAAAFAVVAMMAMGIAPAYAEDALPLETLSSVAAQAPESAPADGITGASAEAPAENLAEVEAQDPAPSTPAEPAPAAEDPAPLVPAPAPEPAAAPAPAPAASSETPPPAESAPAASVPAPETSTAPVPLEATSTDGAKDEAGEAEPEPPYARWLAVDETGAILQNTSFTVQGPRALGIADDAAAPDAPWVAGLTATVTDNTGQEGYVGADLDPAPGAFLVKELTDQADPTRTHEVVADERYRVRPAQAPEGMLVLKDAVWAELSVATTAETPVGDVVLTALVQTAAPVEGMKALPAADGISVLQLEESGRYGPGKDADNPTSWYSSGSPCSACEIESFTSSYEQIDGVWELNATWVRPNTGGSMGWSIEYTNAAERWGGAGTNGGDGTDVPQPDRSDGGMVLFIDNASDNGNYSTQLCLYSTSDGYPGNNCQPVAAAITSNDGGSTMTMNLVLPDWAAGNQGCPSTLGSTGYFRSWTGNNTVKVRNLEAWAAPVTVDPPSSCGTTTLKITKMGDRTTALLIPGNSLTAGTPVLGATYDAFASTGGNNPQPTGPSLGSCTTDANGVCEIEVSNSYTDGVWVQETAAPAGWSSIPALGTGDYDSAKTITPYQFLIEIDGGTNDETKNVTADRERPNTQVSGAWANVRDNPPFPQTCGIEMAMVFDTSSSISSAEMADFRNAAQLFVGNSGLGGTPSQATMFEFNTTARTLNSGLPYDLAIPGSASGNSGYLGAAALIGAELQGAGSGYTNWDAALRLVKATSNYDLVLFLTDGDPTTHGNGSSTSTNVQFRMVEQAVLSANALKNSSAPAGGATKIVGIGVGLSSHSDLNLRAITGPTPGDDYFLAGDFAQLEGLLAEIALKNCGSTLSVIKQIINADGGVEVANAEGWEFTATGDVVDDSPATQTTTTSGTNFTLTFNDQNVHEVSVSEVPQSGYEYVGATCMNDAGDVVDIDNGFTVGLSLGLITSCTVTNREIPQLADVVWTKTDDQTPAAMLGGSEWTIVGPGHPAPGSVIIDCVAAECTGLDKDPAVGGFKLEGLEWGEYTVTETLTPVGHSGGSSFTFEVDSETAGTVIDKGAFENPRLLGTVTWAKVSAVTEELLTGSEWKIVGPTPATAEFVVFDCSATPCIGLDLDPVGGQFEVQGLAWGDYTVVETKAPPGHLLDTTEHVFSITAENVSTPIDLGDFENVPATPPMIPLTGGIGTDQVLLAGAGVLALALLTGLALQRRSRATKGA